MCPLPSVRHHESLHASESLLLISRLSTSLLWPAVAGVLGVHPEYRVRMSHIDLIAHL